MDPDMAAAVVKRLAYEFVAECWRWGFDPAALVVEAATQLDVEYAAQGAEPVGERP